MGMCAPLNGFDDDVHQSQRDDPTFSKNYRVDEHFSWTMPFETIQDDLRSVHMDVMKLGKELVEDFQQNVNQSGCSCVSGNSDSQVEQTVQFEQTTQFATLDQMKLA